MLRAPAAVLTLLSLAACGGDSGSPVHEPPAPQRRQVCGADGFCWDNPLPQGGQINALWASAWNDVWAGGSDGLFHFDGAAWSAVLLPGGSTKVRALWGSSARDVWAGSDALFHFDGKTWSAATGVPDAADAIYFSLAGSGPREAWVLRDTGNGPDEKHAILRWDGSAWTPQYGPVAPSLNSLFSPGAGTAWAVGIQLPSKSGLALKLAGGTWSPVATPAGDPLNAVWGSGANDVWAVGSSTALHWDGTAWSKSPLSLPAGAPLRALSGSGPSDVWAGGAGTVIHWDGHAWSLAYGGSGFDDRSVRALVSTGPQNSWAAGAAGLILHQDAAGWTSFEKGAIEYLDGVFATSATDAWAVGGHGLALHFDGHAWSAVTTPTLEPLYGVWGSSANDAWIAGASGDCMGFILRWNGAAWKTVYGPAPSTCFSGIWGTSATDVWAVAYQQLLHWDGANWTKTGPTDVSHTVWAGSASNVWVLQDSISGGPTPPGSVYHFNGTSWALVSTGSSAQLRTIWGSGPTDVWIASDDTTNVLRWNGTAFSPVPTGLPDSGLGTISLWGTGPADAWLGAAGAPILHWNGTAWSSPPGAEARSVTGLGGAGKAVFAVGPDGSIWAR